MKEFVLIINHTSMISLGGIERYISSLTKYLINNNYRVIWFCDRIPRVSDEYKEVMLSEKVQRVPIKNHGLYWFKITEKVHLKKSERIVMISFEPSEMLKSEFFISHNKNFDIFSLYLVPDTNGVQYYPDHNFAGLLKKIVFSHMRNNVIRWEKEQRIRFFSSQQVAPLEKNYNMIINNPDNKILKNINSIPDLDNELLVWRAKRDSFNIITIGRFDFPHKGYMLGLIRAFARLKKRYPFIKLIIIGSGNGENTLKNEIHNLDIDSQKSISIIGAVAPNKLSYYLSKTHLNISVAGAATEGAKNGVLTITARNYCSGECEVYGFLPDNFSKTTSLEPGEIVDTYIEQAINMTEEEYIYYCRSAHNVLKNRDVDPLYIFNSSKELHNCSIDMKEIRFMKYLSYIIKVKYKLKKRN